MVVSNIMSDLVEAVVGRFPFRDCDGHVYQLGEEVVVPAAVAEYYGWRHVQPLDEPDEVTYVCGAPLASGGSCGRSVDTPEAHCYQHAEEE